MGPSHGEPSDQRLPLLDGIRGVAIAIVLLGHSVILRFPAVGGVIGSLGVSVFFVLSGYLITQAMLRDEREHGQLRLGRFYFRRALRIFPAFYVYLSVTGLLTLGGLLSGTDLKTWLASGIYLRNLIGSGWDTGHLWSLALEEQFYLLWPTLFVLTRRFRLPFLGGAVLLAIAWKTLWVYGHHGAAVDFEYPGGLHWRTDLRLDTFLVGAAFAIGKWKWVQNAPVDILAALLLLWHPTAPGFAMLQGMETTVSAFLIATIIAWTTLNPERLTGRILSGRVAVMLGMLSYSIYLWQELFLGVHMHWWGLPATGAAAFISWRTVERPFLRLRDQWGAAQRQEASPRLAELAGFAMPEAQ